MNIATNTLISIPVAIRFQGIDLDFSIEEDNGMTTDNLPTMGVQSFEALKRTNEHGAE